MKRIVFALLLLVTVAPVRAAEPVVALQPVATGLLRPVAIAHAGDARLFVVQQPGMIAIVEDGVVLPQPFLDIRPLVSSGGERGLLGLAFHPRYAENGFFFVNYTNLNGDTIVARYSVSASDPNRADPASARQILFVAQPFGNHNGGQIAFGPDRYLYIGLGDGWSGNDPLNAGQDLGQLLGKILRIDVDAGEPYAIPSTNPFATTPGARDEIWAYGLRNPWRFAFDRATGDLWIADVGQGLWEEVNFQPASSAGGENYGWRRMEGTHCFNPSSNCNDGTLVLPVIEYGHTGGACSVTGGYVHRGTRFPRLHGMYIYGDYCDGIIRGARRDASGTVTSRALLDTSFFISTFGDGADGELYVADHNGGAIYRIVDTSTPAPRRRAVRH